MSISWDSTFYILQHRLTHLLWQIYVYRQAKFTFSWKRCQYTKKKKSHAGKMDAGCFRKYGTPWVYLCLCVCVCEWVKVEEYRMHSTSFSHTNAAHIHPKCINKKHLGGEQRTSLKNQHELFNPSDKRTDREWERDVGEKWRKRSGDRVWVIQRDRQMDRQGQ